MMPRRPTEPADASCSALPFVFVPFIINFPAGLLVYWITTNLWTIGQQYVIRRTSGAECPARPASRPGSTALRSRPRRGEARRRAADSAATAGQGEAEPNGRDGGAGAERATRATAPPPPPAAARRRSAPGGADELTDVARGTVQRAARGASSTALGPRRGASRSTRRRRRSSPATSHGEDLGLFIGRHGQTIDAVQHLAQRIARGGGAARATARRRRRRGLPRPPRGGAAAPGRPGRRRGGPLRPPGRARRDDARASASSSTSTCATAATSRRTARATSPTATSSSRPSSELTLHAGRLLAADVSRFTVVR